MTNGEMEEPSEVLKAGQKKMSVLKRVSNGFIGILEAAFYKLGFMVGSHPVITIILCFLVSGLCSIGMKDLQPTSETEKLWVPATSRVQWEKKWVLKHFPPVTRYSSLIITNDNILTPESLQAMIEIYKKAKDIRSKGHNLETMCFRVGPLCHVTSVLELWYNNENLIKSLTQKDILDKVNNITFSPLYHGELDVTSFLGSIRRDENGRIVGAKAASMLFLLKDKAEWKDAAMQWELDMVDMATSGQSGLRHVYIYTTRSFDDEGYGAVNSDISLLSLGFSIVLVYLILTLGRANLLEQKLYLSLAGLMSVGLAIGLAYGLAIACGVLYGPVHGIMPFLLLGIGVDDMFVIVEAWKNLTPEEKKYSLPERMALTLKNAGVSVTVTSVTDVVAFAIGASTVIPGLSAFCVYASIGILALYGLQSTFFVACLTLDQMRQEASRDGCIVCYIHKNYVPNACSQKNIMSIFFEKYLAPNLMKLPFKLLAVVITCTILGVNIWGFINLQQDFDLTDYIPSDSYAHHYAVARDTYFPSEGETVNVYCADMFYHENVDNLNKMYEDISKDPYVVNGSVIFWFRAFSDWYNSIKHEKWVQQHLDNKTNYIKTRAEFSRMMWRFLYYTDVGQAYRQYAYFKNGSVIPELEGTYFTLHHTKQPNSKAEITAMESLRKILDNTAFSPKCFAYTSVYLTYETNKVLQNELYRNLLLAMVCVFVVTLLLIANIRTSLIVFTCVIFTVVDVAGTLYFWKVTIDTASSILLTLSVGLAVDYSAHIGHMFMTVRGTREERAVLTLKKIGPAVFSGGFSTFLAFVLLSRSYSYGFSLFFRVFFSVVVFGLFHGLIYLPVILSWLGPDPYETQTQGNRKHLDVPECTFTKSGHENGKTECETKTNGDGDLSSPWILRNSTAQDCTVLQEDQVPNNSSHSPLLNSQKMHLAESLNKKEDVVPQSPCRTMSDPSKDNYKELSHLDQTGSGEEQPFLQKSEKLDSPWVFQGTAATSTPIFIYSNIDKELKPLSKEQDRVSSIRTEKDPNSGTMENGTLPSQEVGKLENGKTSPEEEKEIKETEVEVPSSPWELRDTVFTSEGVKLLDKSSKSLTGS